MNEHITVIQINKEVIPFNKKSNKCRCKRTCSRGFNRRKVKDLRLSFEMVQACNRRLENTLYRKLSVTKINDEGRQHKMK